MGHPRRLKKKYESPKKPYDKPRLEAEYKIKKDFGLKRKHEIRRAESILRQFRRRARDLQAKMNEREKEELFQKLNNIGMSCNSLGDVLEIRLEHILSRRLQTIVYKKGLTNSPNQARQLITHGHVLVGDRKVLWPSYIVKKKEENSVKISPKISGKIITQGIKKSDNV